MNEFFDFNFIIHEANFCTVSKEWERVVAIYPYNRIYYVTEGKAEIFLKDKSILLEPGYIYFLPAFNVLKSNLYENMTHYYLHFLPANSVGPNNLLDSFTIKTKVKANKNIKLLFDFAMQNRFGNTIQEKLILDSTLKYLLSYLIDKKIKEDLPIWVETIANYTKDHIYEDLEIQNLAKKAGYNRSYFSVIFKNYFKCSPKEYILSEKIKTAQLLFVNKDLTLTQIAEKLSFKSVMYFSRIFKKKTGLTPSEYRNNLIHN